MAISITTLSIATLPLCCVLHFIYCNVERNFAESQYAMTLYDECRGSPLEPTILLAHLPISAWSSFRQ